MRLFFVKMQGEQHLPYTILHFLILSNAKWIFDYLIEKIHLCYTGNILEEMWDETGLESDLKVPQNLESYS